MIGPRMTEGLPPEQTRIALAFIAHRRAERHKGARDQATGMIELLALLLNIHDDDCAALVEDEAARMSASVTGSS